MHTPSQLLKHYPAVDTARAHEDLLTRVYRHRGADPQRHRDYRLRHLHAADTLQGIETAVTLLEQALVTQAHILILGDFDADGATSTALAVRALRLLGAQRVSYLVPNRFAYGYGLSPEIVAVAARSRPDVLITVDNGISSLDGVRAAQAAGMRVLITDHHLPGAVLPPADAIINPNLPGDTFPSKHLAGVGVIFYVLQVLRTHLQRQGWFRAQARTPPDLSPLLDLVALGTVADVAVLDYNNRILVEQGLRRIRAAQGSSPGIFALAEVAGRDPAQLNATDLGFAIGPRLNAAGRLDDMSIGIECLLSDDLYAARALASQLDTLNTERRSIESKMQSQALEILANLNGKTPADDHPHGICLYQADWHQGIIGILASRIKERLHRPVIAFAKGEDGELKGSARSIPGLHIRDTLERMAAQHPGLIQRFGGHAMAAGLSIAEAAFSDFREIFDQSVRERLDPQHLQGVLLSDGPLQAHEFSLETAWALRMGGPWGQGFPEPLFDGTFEILQRRVVGQRHLRLTLRPETGAHPIIGMAFNADAAQWPEDVRWMHLAYRLEINAFRGEFTPQLVIVWQQPLR
ncbi:single-stranded-DNA-specific exonuclease RecJ [Thiorhodospira sibirica]|uniref:single-stranded-DNA-specific exonuclease RecJ n=1 Tax=Thiorhodospira sibirica TaxID=154347 RepID=UPI00022C0AE0|nr:single-stranded-DNA-specific exonuclease RecJ [Thiorhodospira sibirica]